MIAGERSQTISRSECQWGRGNTEISTVSRVGVLAMSGVGVPSVVPLTQVDIGCYIGMPLIASVGPMNSISSVNPNASLIVNPNASRFLCCWRIKTIEKGKGPTVSESHEEGVIEAEAHNQNTRFSVGMGHSNWAQAGKRSFADVAAGLSDLSSLPKLVTQGGITRVIIPQATYERQLEKYKHALKGKVFTRGLLHRKMKVEYESLVPRCTLCRKYGHLAKDCKLATSKTMESDKRREVNTNTVSGVQQPATIVGMSSSS
ncbi:hypothetical protein NE237_001688 [Protea cynaroides]|uniref:CCHC-type domain-containing protein n=1 Tax=Protea cynaroides TaxID=273540 RepID=A0A9Q0KTK4_9MAGN|nr:hypothetical protein NE237_001688 [Protea cynaroides]